MVDDNSGPAPIALDDATRGAIEQLITSRIEAAFNNLQLPPHPAPPAADDRRGADTAEPPPDSRAGSSIAGAGHIVAGEEEAPEDGDNDPAGTYNLPVGSQRPSVGWADGGGGGGGRDASDDSGGFSDSDADGTGPQALTPRWYERRRGYYIESAFEIPKRLDPRFPVRFRPNDAEFFATFGVSRSSDGRALEAEKLYNVAAYSAEANNSILAGLESVAAVAEECTDDAVRVKLAEAVDHFATAQTQAYGLFEISASEYAVLCGKQGAPGVADPTLLEAYLQPDAGLSAANRQARARQQSQTIRYAAQQAGRRPGYGSHRRNPPAAIQQLRAGGGEGPRAAGAGSGSGAGGGGGRRHNRGRGRGRGRGSSSS
jgi:hypothetical protein